MGRRPRWSGKVPAERVRPAAPGRVGPGRGASAAPPAGDEAERAAVFALVEAGFGQRRKMLRRSLADRVAAEAFAAAGVRPEARRRGARRWPSLAGACAAVPYGRRDGRACSAPAKLTRSLRVTGVRPDGYHLIDAEMVSARPRRRAHLRRRRRPRGRRAPAPTCPPTTTTSCAGRSAPSGRDGPGRARASASRPAPASAAGRPTRPPCCAGPAAPTSTVAAAPRRRRAVLPGRRAGPGAGDRRAGRAAAAPRPHLHAAHPAGALLHRRPSTGPGTTSAARRPTAPTTSSRRRCVVAPELAALARRAAATRTGQVAGARRERLDLVRGGRPSRARPRRGPHVTRDADP